MNTACSRKGENKMTSILGKEERKLGGLLYIVMICTWISGLFMMISLTAH